MKHFIINDIDFGVTFLPFNDYLLTERKKNKCDILIFSYNCFDKVDLSSEIDGDTNALYRLTSLSGYNRQTIFAGFTSLYEGDERLSAAVLHKGALIDLSDSIQTIDDIDNTYNSAVKVYNIGGYHIALIIDGDILSSRIWKKISKVCSLVINLGKNTNVTTFEKAKHFSDEYSIPLLSVTLNKAYYNDVKPKTTE